MAVDVVARGDLPFPRSLHCVTNRPWREIMLQLTASIMIPLTIAGMGLYYNTRWQQNLNDLKTMIRLG